MSTEAAAQARAAPATQERKMTSPILTALDALSATADAAQKRYSAARDELNAAFEANIAAVEKAGGKAYLAYSTGMVEAARAVAAAAARVEAAAEEQERLAEAEASVAGPYLAAEYRAGRFKLVTPEEAYTHYGLHDESGEGTLLEAHTGAYYDEETGAICYQDSSCRVFLISPETGEVTDRM